jgi:hypothetical protein
MAGASLFWEKSAAGWLLVADLLWEKSTAGWWLISQANRAHVGTHDFTQSQIITPMWPRKSVTHAFLRTSAAQSRPGAHALSWPVAARSDKILRAEARRPGTSTDNCLPKRDYERERSRNKGEPGPRGHPHPSDMDSFVRGESRPGRKRVRSGGTAVFFTAWSMRAHRTPVSLIRRRGGPGARPVASGATALFFWK